MDKLKIKENECALGTKVSCYFNLSLRTLISSVAQLWVCCFTCDIEIKDNHLRVILDGPALYTINGLNGEIMQELKRIFGKLEWATVNHLSQLLPCYEGSWSDQTTKHWVYAPWNKEWQVITTNWNQRNPHQTQGNHKQTNRLATKLNHDKITDFREL